MLDIFSQYATDEGLENNGTWRKLANGAEVLVARGGNRAYSKALNKAIDARRQELDAAGDEADKVSDDIMAGVMAETVLLGWKDLGFKGEPLPYSVSNAKKLLGVKDFRRVIAGFADEFEAYRVKQEDVQGKT